MGLTKIKELTLIAASQKTSMTVGALKVAVHRGLQMLRQRLGGRDRSMDPDRSNAVGLVLSMKQSLLTTIVEASLK